MDTSSSGSSQKATATVTSPNAPVDHSNVFSEEDELQKAIQLSLQRDVASSDSELEKAMKMSMECK